MTPPTDPSEPRAGLKLRRGPTLTAAATFFYWLSLYFYVPILPLHARELGASLTMVGAVVAAYAIAQVVLRLPLGIAVDLYGRRKPFAIAGMGVSAIGALLLAAAADPALLFGARAVTGIAAAGWVPISILYASYFPEGATTRAMGVIMAINSSGLVIGTLSGGLLAERFGAESTFFAGAAAALVGTILLIAAPERTIARRAAKHSARTILSVIKSPLLLQISAIGITTQFVSFSANFGFLPVYAESIGAGQAQVGYITTTVLTAGVMGAFAAVLITERVGYTGTILAASAATLIAMALTPSVASLFPLGALQAMNGLGRGAINTALIALTVRAAPPEHRATAMGGYQAIYAIGMLTGPAVSGALANTMGLNAVFYLAAAVTLLGGGLALVRPLPRR